MTEETGINAPIVFDINDAAIQEVAEQFKEVDAYKDLDEAKAAKKVLTKMRTTLAAAHKEAKADALAYGRRCDAEKNRLLKQITDIEDPISEQLEAIKNAEAAKEAARMMVIDEELERLEAFASDRYSLTLNELQDRQEELAKIEVTEDVYQEFTERATLLKQDSEMKLRLAVDAEQKRLEEEAERERVEEENRKLREQIEAQQKEIEERTRKEAEKQAAEAAEAQRKADIKAEAERKARQKAEEEAAALRKAEEDRLFAEQQRKDEEEAERIAKLNAPDVQKLELYAADINTLIRAKPVMGTNEGNGHLLEALADLIAIETRLRERAEEMK